MAVTLSTPAHVRAHLRSLHHLLESLTNALLALLQSITAGISIWMKQHQVMTLVMERFDVTNFRYPDELPADIRTNLHPGFLSMVRQLYFTPFLLRDFLEEELCAPLRKLMAKLQRWTEEFEFCFSRQRGMSTHNVQRGSNKDELDVPSPSGKAGDLAGSGRVGSEEAFLCSVTSGEAATDTIKERRRKILAQIHKLDLQLSNWLRHYIPKVFGVISVLYTYIAEQFDGKVHRDITPSSANSCANSSHVLPHLSVPASPRQTVSSVRLRTRIGSPDGNDAVATSLPDIVRSSRVSDLVDSDFLSPSGTINTQGSIPSGTALPTRPATSQPLVSFTPTAEPPSRPPPSSSSSSSRRGVLSSREWGGDCYSKPALIKELEQQVDIGRVAFDNCISLSFAFSRSLEKLVDGVLHEDEKYRKFVKIVRQSIFSLEEFVYRDYSELQAMLPLNFVKIIHQLDEQKEKKKGIRTLFSTEKKYKLSPRATAFPVRPIQSVGEQSSGSRAWLDRPMRNEVLRQVDVQEPVVPNPLKEAEFDLQTIEVERQRLLNDTSSHRNQSQSQRSVTALEMMERAPEAEHKVRVCQTVRAFNVLICGYFHRLSMVYEV